MFRDPFDRELDRITEVLKDYEFSEILEENDLTEEEVLTILILDGYIKLPETLPTTLAQYEDGDEDE